MNHRHLLPDEIDLLLDDEVGFGVAPLKAHIRDCEHCRAKVDEARFIVDALEDVPHFAPSHTVFRPGHGAGSGVRSLACHGPGHGRPSGFHSRDRLDSRSGALATSAASIVTVVMLWIATQTDVVALATGVAGDQVRGLVYDAGRQVLATVFGEQFFAVIQRTGTFGIAAALLGLVAAAGGSIAGLRALAAASSRRRALTMRALLAFAALALGGFRASAQARPVDSAKAPQAPAAGAGQIAKEIEERRNAGDKRLPDAENFSFGDRTHRREHGR